MPKADLPQTSTYITKYNRLVQLYLQASKSGAEITELAGLQTELADYQIRASDYNLLNDNVSAVVTKTSEAATTSATLKHGLNTINMTQASGAELTVGGKTLVNILGKDGNCESLTPFTVGGTSPTLSTTQVKQGTNSFKVAVSAAVGNVFKDYAYPLDTAKYYVVATWVYIESWTSGNVKIRLSDYGTTTERYAGLANTSTIGSWQFVYFKIPTGNALVGSGFRLTFGATASDTFTAYYDSVRLYELSSTDYTAIGTTYTATTTPSIDDFIPYVDSVQHSQGVAIRKTGKNLLPPITQWTLHANAVVTEPYKLTLNATASSQRTGIEIKVIAGQQFTLSQQSSVNSQVYFMARDTNSSGTILGTTQSATSVTVTAPSSGLLWITTQNDSTSGALVYDRPQLELGSVATQFVEKNDDYTYIPTVLASNVDRSVVDTYNSALGTVTRRWRSGLVLDGSLAWSFSTDYSGYKRATTPIPSNALINHFPMATKFNGAVLQGSSSFTAGDQVNIGSSSISITFNDTDSGFGETYTPTAGEIYAYFFGYKMNNGTFGTPYNGSGTKTWTLWNATDNTGSVTTVPTTLATGFTPYKLDYQLATSVEETLTGDIGAISLHNGGNQCELLEGFIIREKITPTQHSTNLNWYINEKGVSSSVVDCPLKYRVASFIAIYKNGVKDNNWTYTTDSSNTNGTIYASISNANYDTTAEYTVTYTTLDKYLYTANAIDATVKYQSTLGSTVAKNVQDIADIKTVSGVHAAHVAKTTASVHGSTSAATPNTLMHRDVNGRVKVGAPSANDDVARLDTVKNFSGYYITPQTPVSLGLGGTIVPKLNTQVTVGNSTYFLGTVSGTWKVLRFDWSSKTWTQLASTPASTGTPDSFSNATYNATDNVIYFVTYASTPNYYVLKYDITGNTCTTLYTQAAANNNNLSGAVSYYNGKILLLYPGTSTSPYTYYYTDWRILNTSGVSQGSGSTSQSLGTSSVPIVATCNEYQGALLMGNTNYSPFTMYKIVMDASLNTVTVSTVGTHGSSYHTQLGSGLFVVTENGSTATGRIRDMNNSVVAVFPSSSIIDFNFVPNPQNTTEFELWKFVADGSVYRVLLNKTYT